MSGQRCFSDTLSSQVCVCFSLFTTHWKGSSESKSGSVSNAYNSPSMTRPNMVSRVQSALKDLLKNRRTSSSKHHESACKNDVAGVISKRYLPLTVSPISLFKKKQWDENWSSLEPKTAMTLFLNMS